MTLVLDASTPAHTVNSGSATTVVSPSFSPPAGSVVFACMGNVHGGGTLASVADTSGATWHTLFTGLNATDWAYAFFPTAPGAITVTTTYSTTGAYYMQALVWTGAKSTQSGNASHGSGFGGGLSYGSITTTAAGSMAAMVMFQNSATTPTPTAGQSITTGGSSSFDSSNEQWAQITTTPAGAAGSTITMATTAPTGTTSNEGAIVEILAAPTATNQFFGVL